MQDLIKALKIFAKYRAVDVISCDHDVMYIHISPMEVNSKDITFLDVVGFTPNWGDHNFYSFRFGSC